MFKLPWDTKMSPSLMYGEDPKTGGEMGGTGKSQSWDRLHAS